MSARKRPPLGEILKRLEAAGGPPRPFPVTDPLEMILWENVAYLADDAARLEAFRTLRKRVGTRPQEILAAPKALLVEIAGAEIMAEGQAAKLRDVAEIAEEEFGGDLRPVLKLPFATAKKALRRFPGIGEPGAEKILLFTGTHPVLALESNGLRALVRLGFGEEKKDYAGTYRSVREAVKDGLREDCAWLVRAHQLLRRHGQDICRRSDPECERCPLARGCAFFESRNGARSFKKS